MKNTARLLMILASVIGVIAIYSFTISRIENYEELILGEWAEKQWKYEKVYYRNDMEFVDNAISETDKISAQDGIIFHFAEEWEFLESGKFLFSTNQVTKSARWAIKGRGDILEIRHGDGMCERYTISKLSPHQMVLHFHTDIQVKGITKLTFERK